MDANVLIGTAAAGVGTVASIVSALLIIFHGGRQVGKVEAAISRLSSIEEKVKEVPELKVKIEQATEFAARIKSDHKELNGKFDELKEKIETIREKQAEMRGRFQSQHD